MTETGPQIIEAKFAKEPIQTKKRVEAALKTFFSNRKVLTDVDLLAAESLLYLVDPRFVAPTIILQWTTFIGRPLLAYLSNDFSELHTQADNKRRQLKDSRTFIGILADAWKTGEVQNKKQTTRPAGSPFG